MTSLSTSGRWLLTGALVSCCALVSHAQSVPAPPATSTSPATVAPLLKADQMQPGISYKDYLGQRYAAEADKEARAAVHLFGRKSNGGLLWLGTGAAFITFVTAKTGTTTSSSGTTTVTVTPLGYALLVGLFGGVGIGKLARFSKGRLYEALKEYDEHRTLPDYVTAKLKGSDYR